MKYDRPVWQLMYDCAAAMPDPFRYEDVHRWFARHYPQVGQATIRAHLVGMSEGGRPKQPQFAVRAPLFRRVARGEYEVIPEGERKLDPDLPDGPPDDGPDGGSPPPSGLDGPMPARERALDPFAASAFDDATVVPAQSPPPAADDFEEIVQRSGLATTPMDVPDPTAESADVLLLGGEGERVLVPAPAREVYRSETFQAARTRAQGRGATWFVLSSEHGLLEPSEWVSPDSRELADLDPHYRHVWAQWVLARLESLDGSVRGRRVHVQAPAAYVGPLAAVLQDGGAEVTVGAAAPDAPQVRAVPAEPRQVPLGPTHEPRPEPTSHDAPVARAVGHDVVPAAAPVAGSSVGEGRAEPDAGELVAATRHLVESGHAIAPQLLDAIQDVPGLFAWHVDAEGARMLNRSLRLPVRAGVLHVGHAGAGGLRPDAVTSLRHLVQDVQLRGRSRSSTFRGHLATILRRPLRMTSLDDPALTAWMGEHLTVVTWPTADRDGLHALAHHVVAALEPPLNVDHLRAADVRQRLAQLRAEQEAC
jgi:hypothetical protein